MAGVCGIGILGRNDVAGVCGIGILGRGDVAGVCGIGILGRGDAAGVCGVGILGQWCVWCWYLGTAVWQVFVALVFWVGMM